MDSHDVSLADNDVRYVPDSINYGFCGLAHESRYQWVIADFDISSKRILDFGCGSGYGTHMLSKVAQKVDAIDYSSTAIEFARSSYAQDNTSFFSANACSAKEVFGCLSPRSYDIVVSFDVIEHLERYFDYLSNICNLMKDDGTLIIGCPNRVQTFNWNKSWNAYHFQEFSPYQLRSILSLFFENVKIGCQDFRDDAKRETTRLSCLNSQGGLLAPIKKLVPTSLKKTLKGIIRGSRPKQQPKCDYSEIEFHIEPEESILENAFGLIAICSKVKRQNELLKQQ